MNCIRNMRSHTLTHGAGAYTWKIWPASNGTGISGAPDPVRGISVNISPKPMQEQVSFLVDLPGVQYKTRLTIYNEAGQAVYHAAGRKNIASLQWNGITEGGRMADPGVYFFQISNGKQNDYLMENIQYMLKVKIL